jgi:hypothetical protein
MGFVLYPPTKETFLLLARFGLVATLSLSAIGFNVNSSNQDVEVTTTTTVQTEVSTSTVHTMSVAPTELQMQLATRKAGSVKFWEAVSWCETNHKWNDGGYYSGGLGMAQSVWVNYGGKQFAPRPPQATKEEQITVANRVAFFGFQTKNVYLTLEDRENNKPYFRPAVGWRSMKNWGKNCANWRTRKPVRERYTEAGMIEWKKSRGES